jgi:chromosome segregation ATPase
MALPEQQLTTKLEAIRDSIVGFKFVTDSLLDRADKSESESANLRAELADLRNNTIRTDERIATIQRYLDTMSGDIRAVRNSVVGAVIAAVIIGVAGVAASSWRVTPIHTNSQTSAIVGRGA